MSGTVSDTAVFFRPIRMLGFIIPDCTIEERHSDRLQITNQPVEMGAEISDHAFMLPFEVSLRYGWSDSSVGAAGSVLEVYNQLQTLQQSRQPFSLTTGKRVYQTMLLEEISVTTDSHTENALMVEAHCRQIIIVSTSEVQADPSNQADPASTQGITSTGPQQLLPLSNSPAVPGLNLAGAGP